MDLLTGKAKVLPLVPAYVATLSGTYNLALSGAAVALMQLCSALAQLIGYGGPARRLEQAGLPLLAAGLVLLALAGSVASLPLGLPVIGVGLPATALSDLDGDAPVRLHPVTRAGTPVPHQDLPWNDLVRIRVTGHLPGHAARLRRISR
ncbi:hypothetical protein AB0K18_09925 [Nonomuraea sp. NPDC049421]|uniref:hypothetical protein n=1 Tax=Nonomuraea sp. NPDC049421 TaxID=3155275 RepID=UPI00341B0284